MRDPLKKNAGTFARSAVSVFERFRWGRNPQQALVLLFIIVTACTTAQAGITRGSNQGLGANDSLGRWRENEWYLPVDSSCRIYVREIGTGPLVVVLHDGWGYEHSYMVDGFRRLADRYRFVFYDQRGSLRSPCNYPVNIEGHVADLDRLRLALNLKKMILVGHGMGGYLAMRYASAHPDRVGGISLLAPFPARGADLLLPDRDKLKERFRRPRSIAEFRRMGIDIERSDTAVRIKALEHRIAKAAAYLHNVERWPQLSGTLFYNNKVSDAAGAPPVTEDLTSALSRLGLPIQVIFPDDDYLPVDVSTRWVSAVPNAELTIIPNAGHVLWIDAPKAFEQDLTAYLNRVTGYKEPSAQH